MKCLLPNDAALGGTVVATCITNEFEDFETEEWLVHQALVVLMPEPPYFKVALVSYFPSDKELTVLCEYAHHNIVPAIIGDVFPKVPGYVDLGADY